MVSIAARAIDGAQVIDKGTKEEVDRRVADLLRVAEAKGRFPTPVEDLIAAQRLEASVPESSPLSLATLIKAPLELQRRLKTVKYKVLAILDRRERIVHVRSEDLEVQKRFHKCHEVGHDLCAWHVDDYYLDGAEQLDPRVRGHFEQEANYAAAELLFQQDMFRTLARSSQVGMATIVDLADRFGGSIHAGFRLYVETSLEPIAGLVLRPLDTQEQARFNVKQAFASHRFGERFGWFDDIPHQLSSQEHPDLADAWRELSWGHAVGEGQLNLQERGGKFLDVPFELFSNSYNHFLLVKPTKPSLFKRRTVFASPGRR